MSHYTTGEVAKACGVTVRTVQFYDQKGILIPSALSEGGRRLYSGEDLKRMKIICFLRDTGLSLDTIGQLLREENPGSVISILLEQQKKSLLEEIAERREKLNRLQELKKGVKSASAFSIETIGDIAATMEGRKKLRSMRRTMLLTGIPVTALQWFSIILWIVRGTWWPFSVWLAVAAVWGTLVSRHYYHHVKYICPQCHEIFRPALKEAFLARHTMTARRLTCTACGRRGFCVETWGGEEK